MLSIKGNSKIWSKPLLLFLPFLVLYIIIAIVFHSDVHIADENRYLQYGNNLIRGFYADPSKDIYLDNGPGFPIYLMPFLALGLPLICISIANAILHYFSVVLLFNSLRRIVSLRLTIIFSFFWALYYHAYSGIPFVHTEIFTSFLVSLLIYFFIKAFKDEDGRIGKYVYLSGILIGTIVLTKNIFGYVLLAMLAVSFLLWVFNRKVINYKKSLLILVIALITTSPYLIYSYNFSGRLFYWGSLGGNNLYWMSTPYEGEYGSWYPSHYKEMPDSFSEPYNIPGSGKTVKDNHQKDLNEIYKLRGVEQDDLYKKIAYRNIKAYPLKYLENCFSNAGRILFNTPNSYVLQTPGILINLPLNGTLVVLILFCAIPVLRRWRQLFFLVRFLIIFVLLYFGGSVLASADMRMFTIIVPIILLIISYVMSRTVSIKLNFNENQQP